MLGSGYVPWVCYGVCFGGVQPVYHSYPYTVRCAGLDLKGAGQQRRQLIVPALCADCIMKLIEFLLVFQFVGYESELWQITKGLPTGLQTSVVFANLHMAVCDEFVISKHPDLRFWKRFIDDAFAILPLTAAAMFHEHLNSWNFNIQWEISGSGAHVTFLDIDMKMCSSGALVFETHRKAQNAYLYLPRISCHPPSVFKALIIGETQRLFNTNPKNPCGLDRHIQLFLTKLMRRGYSRQAAEELTQVTVRKAHYKHSNNLPRRAVRSKFFFRTVFGSSLNRSVIKSALKKHWPVVQAVFSKPVDVMMSFHVQPNNFRRNFHLNWHPTRDVSLFPLLRNRAWAGGLGSDFYAHNNHVCR